MSRAPSDEAALLEAPITHFSIRSVTATSSTIEAMDQIRLCKGSFLNKPIPFSIVFSFGALASFGALVAALSKKKWYLVCREDGKDAPSVILHCAG